MKIILDAFGGDNSPEEIIKGAIAYKNKGGQADVSLVGKEEVINKLLKEYGNTHNFEIVNATEVITCEESPTVAVRTKKDSSIVVGTDKVRKEGYDAFVSAGSTGAVLTAAVTRIGRVNKLSRPALTTMLPTVNDKEVLLLDCGANADTKEINMVQFAIMGSIYMEKVKGVKNPKVALLSNGTEDEKGNELNHKVLPVLRSLPQINFVGNIEGRDILMGDVDVIVSEGFAGNIALKSIESAVICLTSKLKTSIKSSKLASIGYMLFMKKTFKKLFKTLDYNKRGGALLLGCKSVVVKIHGSSKETSVVAGLFQAEEACKYNLNSEIEAMLADEQIASLRFE